MKIDYRIVNGECVGATVDLDFTDEKDAMAFTAAQKELFKLRCMVADFGIFLKGGMIMVWDRRYGPGLIKGELDWRLGSPGSAVRLAPLRLSLQGLVSALQMVDAPSREDLCWYLGQVEKLFEPYLPPEPPPAQPARRP